MPSQRSLFQTAVDANVPRQTRETAINGLAMAGATTQLRVIVVTSGLAGPYRRQALSALDLCGATDELERLAADSSLHRSLRKQAEASV
ncbi:hypothetical protein [Natrinema limicola]|uniref:Uncharacterized protein n=1 Tax=Natrinema limicola JCM 13563 TaxID=1230457 RepID=M0C2A9_9EURY|nr:hypothetical protein [Natrinema limicola]ELZ17426.1 hypothetical protein C476_15790 [Natrinema limicola JCM 13563]